MMRLLGFGLVLSAALNLAAAEATARGGGRMANGGQTARRGFGYSQSSYRNSSAAMTQQQWMMQHRFRYGQSNSANQKGRRLTADPRAAAPVRQPALVDRSAFYQENKVLVVSSAQCAALTNGP